MKGLPPVSKSGFLLGVGLALAAAMVKIVFLKDMEEKYEAKETGNAALPTLGNAAASRG